MNFFQRSSCAAVRLYAPNVLTEAWLPCVAKLAAYETNSSVMIRVPWSLR